MKYKKIDRLVVVCNSSSQPRIHKRVDALGKIITIKVFGFRRPVYESNHFSPAVDYISLGYIQDRNYLKRIPKLFQAWFSILKESNKEDGLYAFGFDCFLIGKLAGIKYSIIELGDLRSANKPKSIMARIERLVLRNADKIVITSPYFYDFYFKNYGFSKDKFLLLENKLPPNKTRERLVKQSRRDGEKIRIGLIGFFRYYRQIEFIVEFVKSNSDHFTLECFGAGPCLELIQKENCESIRYHGEFRSPNDLDSIYSQIDLNYICYEPKDENVKIALPNKYYESVFYNTPIICSASTALQIEVEKNKVGIAIQFIEENDGSEKLKSVDKNFIGMCSRNCNEIDINSLLDDSEIRLRGVINNV